jgi:hypothetical protein
VAKRTALGVWGVLRGQIGNLGEIWTDPYGLPYSLLKGLLVST